MTQIYTKGSFIIFKASNGFIIYNTDKEFDSGHTHLCSFESAKYVIQLASKKRVPCHLDTYRLISLIRITDDETYRNKIESLVDSKKNRRKSYTNYKRCS